VVGYRAGGISLQINHGFNGFLVDIGNTWQVAQHLKDIFSNNAFREKLSQQALGSYNEDMFTVSNAINWLFLANHIYEKNKVPLGAMSTLNDFWREDMRQIGDVCRDIEYYVRLSS
jgi:glycosyltransferase involved in cell wall biosynthesis